MKENDVRLNAQLVQLGDPLLQVIPKRLIKTGKIKAGFFASLKTIAIPMVLWYCVYW